MTRRHRFGALLAAALLVMTIAGSACDGEATSSTASAPTTSPAGVADPGEALEDLAASVGLLITMVPGSGLGPEAEQLLGDDGPGALPGTASHISTVPTPGGPVSLVTYEEPMVGEPPMICMAVIGRSGTAATCTMRRNQEDPRLGMYLMTDGGGLDSRNSATVYGGAEAAFAILVTEKQARIGITAAGGWAYAHWPRALGDAASITFYDSDANPGFRATYDLG